MQTRKVRKGICAANLNDLVLWNIIRTAQKAIAQKFRLISELEICASGKGLSPR